MNSEKIVHVADKLYQTRSTAKFMLGSNYSQFTREMASLIREIIDKSPREHLSPLVVAMELSNAPGVDAAHAITILAAAVDMIDGVV